MQRQNSILDAFIQLIGDENSNNYTLDLMKDREFLKLYDRLEEATNQYIQKVHANKERESSTALYHLDKPEEKDVLLEKLAYTSSSAPSISPSNELSSTNDLQEDDKRIEEHYDTKALLKLKTKFDSLLSELRAIFARKNKKEVKAAALEKIRIISAIAIAILSLVDKFNLTKEIKLSATFLYLNEYLLKNAAETIYKSSLSQKDIEPLLKPLNGALYDNTDATIMFNIALQQRDTATNYLSKCFNLSYAPTVRPLVDTLYNRAVLNVFGAEIEFLKDDANLNIVKKYLDTAKFLFQKDTKKRPNIRYKRTSYYLAKEFRLEENYISAIHYFNEALNQNVDDMVNDNQKIKQKLIDTRNELFARNCEEIDSLKQSLKFIDVTINANNHIAIISLPTSTNQNLSGAPLHTIDLYSVNPSMLTKIINRIEAKQEEKEKSLNIPANEVVDVNKLPNSLAKHNNDLSTSLNQQQVKLTLNDKTIEIPNEVPVVDQKSKNKKTIHQSNGKEEVNSELSSNNNIGNVEALAIEDKAPYGIETFKATEVGFSKLYQGLTLYQINENYKSKKVFAFYDKAAAPEIDDKIHEQYENILATNGRGLRKIKGLCDAYRIGTPTHDPRMFSVPEESFVKNDVEHVLIGFKHGTNHKKQQAIYQAIERQKHMDKSERVSKKV